MEITTEEAIRILSTRDSYGMITGYAGGIKEAIDMGLEALKRYDKGYEQAKKDVIKVIHKYFESVMQSVPPTEYIDGEPYHKLGDINAFLTANKELCAIIKSLKAPRGID